MKSVYILMYRLLIILGFGLLLSACSTVQTASSKPNIILICADGMGHMDIREYAHRISGEKKRRIFAETPNLDRLCGESLCFERAYANTLYSHENAGILTGRFATESAVSHKSDQSSRNVTIANVLPGYDSAFIGKWHSSGTPDRMGFSVPVPKEKRGDYTVSTLTQQAAKFIEGRTRKRSKPFFLCLSFSLENEMSHADKKYVRHFEKKLARGDKRHGDSRHAAVVRGVDDSIGQITHKLWR